MLVVGQKRRRKTEKGRGREGGEELEMSEMGPTCAEDVGQVNEMETALGEVHGEARRTPRRGNPKRNLTRKS